MTRLSTIHRTLGVFALALAIVFAVGSGLTGSVTLDNAALAQGEKGPDVRPPAGAQLPVVVQQPRASTTDGWRTIRRGISGYVSIADNKAGIMIQSEGEAWRNINNGPLKNYGGWLLLATIVVLAVFFAIRGRIRVEQGLSGESVERFGGVERFAHWLSATTFIILALTGLNITYGKFVLIPILGPEAFSALSAFGKLLHNYLAFGFMVGVIMMFVLWVKDNILDKYDFVWIAKAGGLFVKGVHPPARKFNFGQKLVFWSVVISGIILSVTGIILLFPFLLTDIYDMQIAQLIHAVVALVMIAVIIAHIYIGSLGMVGAFDAMGNGFVDTNWAKEHHSVWVEEAAGGGKSTAGG